MDADTHLAALRREGSALAATPPSALGRRVPGCPDWTVTALIGHTSWVHRWVTAVLTTPADVELRARDMPTAPEGEAVLGWFADGLAALLDAFAQADLEATYRSFLGPRDGRWWLRRQVHETAVHRWDAQSAYTEPEPIDAELAVDGIDEALETYVSRRFDSSGFGSAGQTLHLHATDVAGEWMLAMEPDGLRWSREHGKGDTALRGPASELLLWLMSRVGTDNLTVFGDEDLPHRWQAAANF